MQYRRRQLAAAAVFVVSALILGYLLFLTPSESNISTPTASMGTASPRTTGVQAGSIFPMLAARDSRPEVHLNRFAEDEISRELEPMPGWMLDISLEPEHTECPGGLNREVQVATQQELKAALDSVKAGDRIVLAAGVYAGNFVADASGKEGEPIWICGSRDAVLDGGGPKGGYGLHVTGSYVGVWGITISNAQKGIVVDGGDFVQIDNVEVHTTGDEAIHFRSNASDGVVQDCLVHHTGLRRDKFGEGIYVGSAVSNWEKYSQGEPDKSDRVRISRNRIWDTSAESIDLKEGTTGGRIELNSFDGTGMTGADSWVDVKGNEYVILGNVGTSAPEDGFQTHNINDLGWGRDNQFFGNTARVKGPGYGFYIHDSEATNNVVSCTNNVTLAESGFSNVECVDS